MSGAPIASIDPRTNELVRQFEAYDRPTCDAVLSAAARSQAQWREEGVIKRAERLRSLAAHLRNELPGYARLITLEMGKPIAQAEAEIEKSAACAEYYADCASEHLAEEPIVTDADRSAVVYRPLGVILGVMPWNYPFWQVLRFAIPTLVAGNGVVLKHASNVPQCALALEDAFVASGFPQHLFRTILIPANAVDRIIEDPRIAGVSLTGSEQAGRHVARIAGGALKPAVMELGGSDPFIVLDDADVESAARAAAQARTLNVGQSCIAAKRFLVDERVRAQFVDGFVSAMKSLTVGDPFDRTVAIGPLARVDLRDEVHDQVRRSEAAGADVVVGGLVPDGGGAFYPPTVLADVTKGMAAVDEEVFGPVGAVMAFDDDTAAVALGNDSPYGLGASIWTRDLGRASILSDRLESGMVFVNGIVKSDPRLPFGGVKASGFGRELGRHGLLEFTNIQARWQRAVST